MEKCALYISAVDYNKSSKLIERVYASSIFGEKKMLLTRKDLFSLLQDRKCTFFLDDRSYSFYVGIYNQKFINTQAIGVAEDRLGYLLSIDNRLGDISDVEYRELQVAGEKFYHKQITN